MITAGPTTATSSPRALGGLKSDNRPNRASLPARNGEVDLSATAITGTAIAISGVMPACGSASAMASVSPYVMRTLSVGRLFSRSSLLHRFSSDS